MRLKKRKRVLNSENQGTRGSLGGERIIDSNDGNETVLAILISFEEEAPELKLPENHRPLTPVQ
ncbi:MAG: hypothetical protein HHJ12_09600 [Glaciimonas sp.]|nr:hypothetical protein [Glaciimonas sp.]